MHKLINKNDYVISVFTKLNLVILSLVSSILINRYLGPTLKGEYAYIFNFVNILSLILNLGIGQSFSYFKRKYGSKISQRYINIFYFQLILYILIIIVINIFYMDITFNVIIILSIFTQFNSQISFMGLIKDVNKRNVISLISTLVYTLLLLGVFFVFNKRLSIIVVVAFIKLLFDSLLTIKTFKILPTSIKISTKLLRKIMKFSLLPMLTSLLITFNYNIDIIILKQFVSYSDIGIYSVGVTLSGMLWIIPDAFKDVLFSKTAKNDSINDIKLGIKLNVYICIIIIIAFCMFGKQFILIVYGIDFIDSYKISVMLFLGCIPMIFFKLINTLYISIGKQKFAFFILLISSLSNIIINYITIPKYNIYGAAFASVLSYFICGIIFLLSFIMKYNLKLQEILFFNKEELKKIKNLIIERK